MDHPANGMSAPAEADAAFGHAPRTQTSKWALVLGSIGVVYGDIGTSPLYALRESVLAAVGPGNPASEPIVLGILSLIVWALIIVVTIKYVVVLLRAHGHEAAERPRAQDA